jgi:hypothetical protein
MLLGEFIKLFSHNNIVRLLYRSGGGYIPVLESWDDVSMDHQILKGEGKYRHYIDNEVLELKSVSFSYGAGSTRYPQALNIVIQKLEYQPSIEERFHEILHDN